MQIPTDSGSNAGPSWCEVVSLLGEALMGAEKPGRFGLSTAFIAGVPSGLPVAITVCTPAFHKTPRIPGVCWNRCSEGHFPPFPLTSDFI